MDHGCFGDCHSPPLSPLLSQDAKLSIPTKFKEVIGVKGIDEIYNDIDYMYNPNNEIQMYSNSKDRLIKWEWIQKGNLQ